MQYIRLQYPLQYFISWISRLNQFQQSTRGSQDQDIPWKFKPPVFTVYSIYIWQIEKYTRVYQRPSISLSNCITVLFSAMSGIFIKEEPDIEY